MNKEIFQHCLHRASLIINRVKQEYPHCDTVRLDGGDPRAPNPGESMAKVLEALTKNLPGFLEVLNKSAPATAQTEYDIAAQYSPQYAQMQNELYKQYGPELNRIAQDINQENALAQASTERDVLRGPGGDVVRESRKLSEEVDPEYYKTRSTTSNALADLFGSINVNGLSGSERAEVERSLARDNSRRGLESPTATSTVENAMHFGSALDAKRNQLGQAVALATSFLPTSRGASDTFMQATGRPGTSGGSTTGNAADALFTGVDKTLANRPYQVGQNILGGAMDMQQTKMEIDSGRRSGFEKVMTSLPDY